MAIKTTISPEVLTILQEWDQREQTWRAAVEAADAAKRTADAAYMAMQQAERQLQPLVLDPEVYVPLGAGLLRIHRNGYGETYITRVTVATVAQSTPAQPDETQPEVQP